VDHAAARLVEADHRWADLLARSAPERLEFYKLSLEAKYQATHAQVDRLTPALLAKAFRGELVPQDPNDEPADALLARLRGDAAQHEGAGPATSKRGRAARSRRPPAPPPANVPAD
jgi:hypothetical protein